jgi:hypothetical protein
MNLPPSRRILPGLILGLAAALPSASALQVSEGELKVSFDSTLSFGGLYRLQNPDRNFYGVTSNFQGLTGTQYSVNADDGNLNYGKGWASQLLKGNHDLEVRYGNFGPTRPPAPRYPTRRGIARSRARSSWTSTAE